jgi:hypothetical protein
LALLCSKYKVPRTSLSNLPVTVREIDFCGGAFAAVERVNGIYHLPRTTCCGILSEGWLKYFLYESTIMFLGIATNYCTKASTVGLLDHYSSQGCFSSRAQGPAGCCFWSSFPREVLYGLICIYHADFSQSSISSWQRAWAANKCGYYNP